MLSCVWLFVTPWTAARQASLSFIASWNLLKLVSIESMKPPNHLILCHAFLLLPSFFPSIRLFSSGCYGPISQLYRGSPEPLQYPPCWPLGVCLTCPNPPSTVPRLTHVWSYHPLSHLCVFLTVTVDSRKEHLGSIMGGRLTFFIIYLFIVLDCLSNGGCLSLKLSNYKQKY